MFEQQQNTREKCVFGEICQCAKVGTTAVKRADLIEHTDGCRAYFSSTVD